MKKRNAAAGIAFLLVGVVALNGTGCSDKTFLDCSRKGLTDLDLSEKTELVWLDCSQNHLTNLDLSANAELTHLSCDDNGITKLDLSANTKLEYVDCEGCPIKEIIFADTNNLPDTFRYDGNPIIREP